MNNRDDQAYQSELKRVAQRLGLPQSGNVENSIIQHCLRQLQEWIDAHGQPATLSELLDQFGPSLNMRFEEVYSEDDFEKLLQRFPPDRDPAMARVQDELKDDTDAITILRVGREAWEVPYLAVINCQSWHEFRRYFSKWHEATHRLLEGQQLTFAFRHTRVERPEPEEVLVDKVAAALAFYPSLFEPVFQEELKREGRVTFATVDRVRKRVAPDASRESTLRACLRHSPHRVHFLRCAMGLKREEERQLNRRQLNLLPEEHSEPKKKLRVLSAAYGPFGIKRGIRFHRNMQVPESSIISQVFHDPRGLANYGMEPLEAWETSSGGPIGQGMIDVEAEQVGIDEVWALIS